MQVQPPGEGPPFSERELAVHQELLRIDPRLAGAYRRAIEIAPFLDRDQSNIVLVGHLAREILNALPRVAAAAPRAERVTYDQALSAIALKWPRQEDGTLGPPSPEALTSMQELVEQHEASRNRRDESEALVCELDPAHRRTVPYSAGRQWGRLRERAVSLAHAYMRDPAQSFPDPSEARAVLNELTATLHAILAPFFESMDEIDALLAKRNVGEADAQEAAAVLKTQTQYAYFFEHADVELAAPASPGGFLRGSAEPRGRRRWLCSNAMVARRNVPRQGCHGRT